MFGMRNCNLHVLFIGTILLLFACSPQHEGSDLLRQAQNLVDTQPEKALLLLDSISYPQNNLSRREYMSYLVTRVQARHRNFLPIYEDIFIFTARDYFARRNRDPRQTALAFFHSGNVYRAQGNSENAIKQYRQAAEYATKANDVDLKGMTHFNIGNLLEQGGFFLKALEAYKKAERFFAKSPDNAPEKQARCFIAIAQMYSVLRQPDNVFATLYKGLDLVRSSENMEIKRILTHNLSVNYRRVHEYEKAENYLRQSFELINDATILSRYYLSFASLFTSMNQPDSVAVYVGKLRETIGQSDDLYFKVAAYHFLVAHTKATGDFYAALVYQEKEMELVEKITRRRLEQSVYEVKRRYDYQRHQEAYMQTRLMLLRRTVAFLVLALSISLFTIFTYHKMVKQKNSLLSLQNAIEMFKHTNDDLIYKQTLKEGYNQSLANKLKETQSWKFNTLFKLLLIKIELDSGKKITADTLALRFSKAVFGKDNPQPWDIVTKIVEDLYPDLLSFIKSNYSLSDTEYKVAVLSFVDVNPKEIATILGKEHVQAIYTTRSSIRSKMNLTDKNIDFEVVLRQEYYSSKTD